MGFRKKRIWSQMDKVDIKMPRSSSFFCYTQWHIKGLFWFFRGLKQGDPLSLFLFTLVVDTFSALMAKVISRSLIEGFTTGRDEFSISYLQFVEDTICFIKAEEEQVLYLKNILLIFETIFKVNLSKSNMVNIGTSDMETDKFVGIFACKKDSWFFKNLGLLFRRSS